MVPTDAQLVAAVADGDQASLRTLFDRHARWLSLRLRRRCGDLGLVDEVVVDTFERAWRHAGSYRGDGDVAAWLWAIAIRRLIDRQRKRVPRPGLPRRMNDWRFGPDGNRRASPAAEDEMLVKLEHSDLGGALERLDPALRSVLEATVLDGLTMAEAAALLGLRESTVKSRAFRARQQLREALR